MIYAYDEVYLSRARQSMGVMLDFAVNKYNLELLDFYEKFLQSSISTEFATGDASTIAGKSGIELVYEIIDPSQELNRIAITQTDIDKSKEYWTGWALAYFQWRSALSFKQVEQYIPIGEVREMYSPYHEMDILQFADKMGELYNKRKRETNLKLMRMALGMSQSDLSKETGIPLRTIQQYEQRQKNINRAAFDYIVTLSQALNCEPIALLEIEL